MKRSWLRCKVFVLCLCSLYALLGQQEVWAAEGDERSNAVPDVVYQNFGLELKDPAEFTTSTDPLEGFESYPLNELYVGYMNRDDDGKYKGKRQLLETLGTPINESKIDIDSWEKAKNTQEKSYHYFNDKEDFEYQFNNAVSFYGEGKDKPALLLETFYGAGKAKDIETEKNETRYNRMMMQLSKRASYTNDFESIGYNGGKVTRHKVLLADSGTDKKYDLLEVPADYTSGLSAMVAGDFNGDGLEEVAVYCPSTRKDSGFDQGGYITFFGYDPKLGLFEHDGTKGNLTKIYLKDVASSAKGTNWNSDVKKQVERSLNGGAWKNLPLIQLSKSTLAKKYSQTNTGGEIEIEDLVISLSTPEGSGGGDSTLSIYSFAKNGKKATKFQEIFAHQFEGDNEKFEYLASQTGDLNGDTMDELVVAGRNGKNHDENLVQLITYEQNAANNQNEPEYNLILLKPASVKKHSKIDLRQPIPLALGNYHVGTFNDSIFLGGRIVDIDSGSLKSDREKSQATIFKEAKLLEKGEMKLSGTNKQPFIHSAYFAHLSTQEATEQLVTVSGDFDGQMNDVYLDMGISIESEEKLKTTYHDNIINEKDKDDHGSFLTVVPINVDEDQMKIKYLGKHTGWSKPQILAVMQANPYWRELSRVDDDDALGSTQFSIATGQGHEKSGSWGVGGSIAAKFAWGGPFNKGGFGFEAAAHYIHETSKQKQTTEERSFTSLAEDSVVMQTQPIVTHKYHIIVNEELGGEGEVENMEIPQILPANFAHIPVTDYQQAAKKAKEQAINYPDIDMNQLLGTTNYQVGDPSSYPKVGGQQNIPIAKEANYFDDKEKIGTYQEYEKTIEINSKMSSVDEYALTINTQSSTGEGWDVQAGIGAGYQYSGIIFECDVDARVEGFGSQLFTDIKTSGTTFSYMYPSIKTERDNIFTGSSYDQNQFNYSVKPAVWRTSAIENGIDDIEYEDGEIYLDNHPYVIGHLVSLKDGQPLSPDVPKETHISKVGSNEIELKWENDYRENREPEKIEIYEAMGDNIGDVYKKRGEVDLNTEDEPTNRFIVGGLKSGTEYRYRIRSIYTDKQTGKPVYSPLQPIATGDNQLESYLKVTTLAEKDELTFNPLKDVSGLLGEKAQFEAELTSAEEEISFGWSRYQISSNSYNGKWLMLEGSEKHEIEKLENRTILGINSVTDEDNGYYRAIAAQGSSGKDAVSNSARFTLATARRQVHDDPHIKAELVASADRLNQFIPFDRQDTRYYLNQMGALEVKATIENSSETGKVAFYLYDESGVERTHTQQQPVKNGEVTTVLKEVAKENMNIVAVYFDETHPEGIPAVALELLKTWPEDQTLIECSMAPSLHAITKDQPENYQVAYNLNGGMDPGNPTSQNPGEGLSLKDPTKEGYEFIGWYYSPTNTGDKSRKAPTVLKGYTNNLELEARWQIKKYNIFYQLGNWKPLHENPDKFTLEQLRLGLVTIHEAIQGTEKGTWYVDYQRTTPFSMLTEDNFGNVFLNSPEKVEEKELPEKTDPDSEKEEDNSPNTTEESKENASNLPSTDDNTNGNDGKYSANAASNRANKNFPQTNDQLNNWIWIGIILVIGVLSKVVHNQKKSN